MIQNFSLHTHTTFSDGRNSISEMVEQAKKLGWKAIGHWQPIYDTSRWHLAI